MRLCTLQVLHIVQRNLPKKQMREKHAEGLVRRPIQVVIICCRAVLDCSTVCAQSVVSLAEDLCAHAMQCLFADCAGVQAGQRSSSRQ